MSSDSYFSHLFPPQTVSLTVIVVSLVAITGLALGAIKFKGISLGIAGVMFTGLILGRLLGKDSLNESVISFIRDFGLILFVYAVGIQVGPGFLASLRKQGLPWSLCAATVVILGAAISVSFVYLFGTNLNAAAGLFSGSTTNAPALGAVSEALKARFGIEQGVKIAGELASPAFAISYPFGLVGVILTMVALRLLFRIDPNKAAEELEQAAKHGKSSLASMNVEVTNPNLNGLKLNQIPIFKSTDVVVSRILHDGKLSIPHGDTPLYTGDVLLAVGSPAGVEDFRVVVGKESTANLLTLQSSLSIRHVIVTHKKVLGKTVEELDLRRRLGVAITRISRAGVEFVAVASGRESDMRLQFGDRLRIVGEDAALDEAAKQLGDSMKELNLPRLMPIFVGIALGVFVGCLSTTFGGALPAPVKLGLAAGPMIIAIALARIGRVGPMIWYMPYSASQLLRELGIVLFLIAVGLLAGDGFFNALASPTGLIWLGLGAIITFVPLMLIGIIAKVFFKMNYLHICGLLAGSMTSPSLGYTQTMTSSEAPALAFATVYPLTMIMRVLLAQLIVLIFS